MSAGRDDGGRPILLATVIVVICGLFIANIFVWRGPSWEATPRALTWQHGALDGGAERSDLRWGDFEFLAVAYADEPALSFGVIRHGDEVIAFDEPNSFEHLVPLDGGVLVVGQLATEGSGPTVDVLETRDQGATFRLVAQVPKPNYQHGLVGAWLEDGALRVRLDALGDELPVADEWAWPWMRLGPLSALRPTTGAREVELWSKNGGRTWYLDTHPPPRPAPP